MGMVGRTFPRADRSAASVSAQEQPIEKSTLALHRRQIVDHLSTDRALALWKRNEPVGQCPTDRGAEIRQIGTPEEMSGIIERTEQVGLMVVVTVAVRH